ncbi:MAG TPA: hypothetical protein VFG10_12660 [Saprospiraceae bacterium]|nr:hypothetical protein [Saprospiraceae bacterium]
MKWIIRIFFALILAIWMLFIAFPYFDLLLVYNTELWGPGYILGAIGFSLFFLVTFLFTMRRTNWFSKYLQ